MQAASDIFLGWDRVPDRDGWQSSRLLRTAVVGSGKSRRYRDDDVRRDDGLWEDVRLDPGSVHARSGDRIAISAYLGKNAAFDHALAEFAVAYADQNERDYQALVEAKKNHWIKAEIGI